MFARHCHVTRYEDHKFMEAVNLMFAGNFSVFRDLT